MQDIEKESELRLLLHCIHKKGNAYYLSQFDCICLFLSLAYEELWPKIEEGVIHRSRKPNSIIVLLFIQHNSQFKNKAKTCLRPSMLSSPSIMHVQGFSAPQMFSKQKTSPFELCSCCSWHVFSYNFAQFLLLKRVKCPPFFVFTTKTTQPRPQVFSVNGALTCTNAAFLTSFPR